MHIKLKLFTGYQILIFYTIIPFKTWGEVDRARHQSRVLAIPVYLAADYEYRGPEALIWLC